MSVDREKLRARRASRNYKARRARVFGAPQPVDKVIDAVFVEAGIDVKIAQHRAWEVWEKVVGGPIARNARPARIDGQTLIIHVSSGTWMTELTYMKDVLLERLNEAVGKTAFDDLRFRLGRLGALRPPPLPPQHQERPLPPPSARESAEIRGFSETLPEGPARDALERIFLRSLRHEARGGHD